jgi:outer membrane translocation and assembly module TamA
LRSERSSLELFVEAKREQIEDVRAEVIEAWAQLTFPLTDRILTRVYTAVGNRNILSGIPSPDLPLEERVISPRFGWQLAYTTVEQGLTTQRRKGFFFGVDISGSHASLGSELTTLGVFTQFKVFAPFGAIRTGRFSWHQSYRSGLLTAREQPIPFVDRLRAGGEFSVRGYPTNGIGPLDPVDHMTPLGGELLFVANQELHARVWDSLFGVVFFDVGNVWLSPADFEPDLFRSVGFGARYTSPVGPLRFDIGFPLDRRSGDAKYQLYVGFGSVF